MSDIKNSYASYLDAEWNRYKEWAASCRCLGCGKSHKDCITGEVWVTEEWCSPCWWSKGIKTFNDTRPKFFNQRREDK